jgi:L-threonylcarbamoyladenylate synthase
VTPTARSAATVAIGYPRPPLVIRGTDIDQAARVLAAGGLVAFPTETVYGLGADARVPAAVARIYAAKGRPTAHPLIVHVGDAAELDRWAADVPPAARVLAAAFWPGPLTLVLARAGALPDAATGGHATVGIRVPSHPLARALLAAFGGPIAAPSANRFGAISPTTADHVAADLGDAVDYLLDGGACEIGVESTIVDLTRGRAVLLRPGGVGRDELERVLGAPVADPDAAAPAAPGTLAAHYAPRARVIAVPDDRLVDEATRAGGGGAVGAVAVLAPAATLARLGAALPRDLVHAPLPDDLAGAARALYATLRDLDARGVSTIIAAIPPALGLGEAVADRLRRAAAPRGTGELDQPRNPDLEDST